jgi:hypothetical protein
MAGPRRNTTRGRAAAAIVAALAVAVIAERAHWFGRVRALALPERTWIWTVDPPRRLAPLAFLAARDFELESLPAEARLEVLGDPEYVVWINGDRVGSGAYVADAALDVYDVLPHLVVGRNRIVLDLRSPIGSGGATARLADEHGTTLVASDSDWFVYRADWHGLLRGEGTWETERVRALGVEPVGRWGLSRRGPIRPTFRAAMAESPVVAAGRYRFLDSENWHPFARSRRRRPPLGGRVLFDFGRSVAGYLQLDVTDGTPSRTALVRVGFSAVAPRDGWQPDIVVVTLAGRGYWQDAVPRRFRYVEVIGLEEVTWAGAVMLADSAYAELVPPAARLGLFGLAPDPVQLPVIDEIWRQWGGAERVRVTNDDAARTPARPRARAGRRRRAAN